MQQTKNFIWSVLLTSESNFLIMHIKESTFSLTWRYVVWPVPPRIVKQWIFILSSIANRFWNKANCPTCNLVPWPYQSTKWFVISPFQVVSEAWDFVATREVPLEKTVDMKCMYAVKHIQKYSKDDKEIVCSYHVTRDLEWIYTLELSECQGTPCSKQTRYMKFKWM